MVFQKGHKINLGSKLVGDKPDSIKIKKKVEEMKEKITQEALLEVANNKVYQAIIAANSHLKVKEVALPITLKGMTENKNVKTNLNISNEEIKKELADKLAELLK